MFLIVNLTREADAIIYINDIRYCAGHSKASITNTMWIPEKLYEALPAIYFAIGAALIGGSIYVGVDRGPELGYLVLGSMCIGAGVVVRDTRHRARLGQDRPRTQDRSRT